MTAYADISNGKTTTTIDLPTVLETLEQANTWITCAMQCAAEATTALEAIKQPLGDRVERNRARYRRANHKAAAMNGDGNGNGNGNGHAPDVRLVVTHHGLIRECRRCGREVTV